MIEYLRNMDVKIGKKFAHMNKKADPRLARERKGSPPLKRAAKGNDWKPGGKQLVQIISLKFAYTHL